MKYFKAILLLIGALGFGGCAVKQDISLHLTGTGTAQGEIELHSSLAAYLSDLSMVMNSEGEPPIFDLPGIEFAFRSSDSIELEALSSPKREILNFSLRFDDLNAPFDDLPEVEQNVFQFTQDGRERTLTLTLNRQNFSQVSAYFPLMDESMMEYFIPQGESQVDEELYKEDLEYALEDYLGDSTIDDILAWSTIVISVKHDGSLVSQDGGTVDEDRVEFTIPLIKVLLLNQELKYSLTFVP